MSADRNAPFSGNGQPAPDDRSDRDSAASAAFDDGPPAEPDAIERLLLLFRELGEYFSYYAAAKADRFKLSLRNTALWIVLAALGFIAVGGLLVIASWLLLIGLAEGLSVLFGDRSWVGNLLTGALLLAGLGSGMYGLAAAFRRAARERTVEDYGKRQARQETRYGRNVSEFANNAGSGKKRAPVSGRSSRQCKNGDEANPAGHERNRPEAG